MPTPNWEVYALIDGSQIGPGFIPANVIDDGGGHFHIDIQVPAATPPGTKYQIVAYDQANAIYGISGFFEIAPYPAITITTASPLPNGTIGAAYSQQLAATGGLGTKTFQFVPGSGSLPGNVTVSSTGLVAAGGGGITGPGGTFDFDVFCTDGIGPGTTKHFTITVPIVGTLVILTASPLPTATQGLPYTSQQLTVTGGAGPFTFTVGAPGMPTGCTLSAAGLFAINTSTAAPGVYTRTFNVANGVQLPGTKDFTWAIDFVPSPTGTQVQLTLLDGCQITITPGATGDVGNLYNNTIADIQTSRQVDFGVGSLNAPAGAVAGGLNIQCTQESNGTIWVKIRNKGLPDGYNNTTTVGSGQPIFRYSLTARMPGRTVLFGDQFGVRRTGDDFVLIDPSDAKTPTRDLSLTIPNGTYSTTRANHFLDGGETIYYRFALVTDPSETTTLPAAPAQANALGILNPNAGRIAARPFLEYILNFYQHDPATYSNSSLPNQLTKFTWLSREQNLVASGHGSYTFFPGDPLTGWSVGGLPFAPVDGVYQRPLIYNTETWMALYALRHGFHTDSYLWGLHWMRRKICTALKQFDATSIHKGRWCQETSGAVGASGPYPDQNRKIGHGGADYVSVWWKSWDEGLAVYRILAPHDPLIVDAFNRRIAAIVAYNPLWGVNGANTSPNAGGNMRPAGHFLMDAWMLFRACIKLGDAANAALLKTAANDYIERMFVCIDQAPGSPKPLWPPCTTDPANTPMNASGGFIRALEHWQIAFTKWMADSGTVDGTAVNTNAGRFAYWKLMMQWWFTNCSGLSSIDGPTGQRRAWCYGVRPNMTGGAATWNGPPIEVDFASSGSSSPNAGSGMYGAWVGAMRPYMTAWFPGAVAPGGITWDTYFDQLARYDDEWTKVAGTVQLTTNNTGSLYAGAGSTGDFNWASWAGKITGQIGYYACDF